MKLSDFEHKSGLKPPIHYRIRLNCFPHCKPGGMIPNLKRVRVTKDTCAVLWRKYGSWEVCKSRFGQFDDPKHYDKALTVKGAIEWAKKNNLKPVGCSFHYDYCGSYIELELSHND